MKHHDLTLWLEALWRRRMIAAWTAIGLFAVIFLGTVLYPPLYESTARLLVSPNRAHYIVSPALQTPSDPNAPVVNDREVTEQDLNSEMELLTQRRLIEQALGDLAGREPAPGPFGAVLSDLANLPSDFTALIQERRGPVACSAARWRSKSASTPR